MKEGKKAPKRRKEPKTQEQVSPLSFPFSFTSFYFLYRSSPFLFFYSPKNRHPVPPSVGLCLLTETDLPLLPISPSTLAENLPTFVSLPSPPSPLFPFPSILLCSFPQQPPKNRGRSNSITGSHGGSASKEIPVGSHGSSSHGGSYGSHGGSFGSYGSSPGSFGDSKHPSYVLLSENGFTQTMYNKYRSACLLERKQMGTGLFFFFFSSRKRNFILNSLL